MINEGGVVADVMVEKRSEVFKSNVGIAAQADPGHLRKA